MSIKQAGKVLLGVVMPVITIKIDSEKYSWLKLFAEVRGKTPSELVKELVLRYIDYQVKRLREVKLGEEVVEEAIKERG